MLGDLYDKWVNDRPKVNDEPDYAAYTMETFLDEHKLKELCLSTIWRWMKYLGMNYSARHKSFYVDGHEREDVVQDRENFCLKYLTQYEQKCLRWVQVKKSQAELIDGLDLTYGYEYTDDLSGEQWLEFHIDTVAPYMKADEPLFGLVADWSVRRPNKDDPTAKRLVIIGQDECVFMQYLLGTKYWTGPKGERPLLPKSEGDAYMVSAFSGRDIAFGLKLTDEEMAEVNRRRKDTSYIDKAAAKELYNCEKKQELKSRRSRDTSSSERTMKGTGTITTWRFN